MGRGSRLRILFGASIVGTIGILVHSNLLIAVAVLLLIFSGVRFPHSAPTNYTEKFGPPEPDDPDSDEAPSSPFNLKPEDFDNPKSK